MKRALIFYLWGRRNAGDMAICLGAATLLIESGYEVSFVSRFTENQYDYIDSKEYIENYFKGVKVHSGVLTFDRDDAKFKKINAYIKGMLKIVNPINDTKLTNLIEKADIVFMNGGNQLRGNRFVDYARLFALFFPFKIGDKLGKKLICLPQSTAKSSKFGYWLLSRKLSVFDKIFIRESISYSKLKENINLDSFVKTTDLGFYIKDNKLARENFVNKYGQMIEGNQNIALVLRSTTIGDIGEFSDSMKEEYSNAILSYINYLGEKNDIFLIVQTKKDKEFTYDIKSRINKDISVKLIEEYDALILREIYKQMNFVIAMRLHAAILSMTANTPVIGYFNKEWGLKNPGIMEDVGMMWTENGDDLIKMSEELMKSRELYVEKIKKFIADEKAKVLATL